MSDRMSWGNACLLIELSHQRFDDGFFFDDVRRIIPAGAGTSHYIRALINKGLIRRVLGCRNKSGARYEVTTDGYRLASLMEAQIRNIVGE